MHQSDFAEALMGHKSVKLMYFAENASDRLKTYLEVEPSLTVSDHAKFDKTLQALFEKCNMLEKKLTRFENYDQNNSIPVLHVSS